jgi:predicted transcriptional regulator
MSEREQFTIRLSKELLGKVREESAIYGDSMNEIITTAVEKEVQFRVRLRLLDEIEEGRRKMAARGLQPDSTALIRELRLGGRGRG